MFFSTNTVKAKQDGKPEKRRVVFSQNVKLKEFAQTVDLERFKDVQKRETRRVEKPFFSSMLGDFAASKDRARVAAQAKAAGVKTATKPAPKKRAAKKAKAGG